MKKPIAIYSSGRSKDTAALRRWCGEQKAPIIWYRDRQDGPARDRPGWTKLMTAVRAGAVRSVVAWQVGRLGLTARGLAAFLTLLREKKVDLHLIDDGVRLSSAAGQRTFRFLESVIRADRAVRANRIVAGQLEARARGAQFGRPVGSGKPIKVTPAQEARVRRLKAAGQKIAAIARTVELSRPTVYSILEREDAGPADHVARSHHARSRGLAGDARRGL